MGRLHKLAIASVASAALLVPFAGTAAAQPAIGGEGGLNLDLGSANIGGDLGALFGLGGGEGGFNIGGDLGLGGFQLGAQGDAAAEWEAFVAWVEREWQLWLEANFGAQGGTGGGGVQGEFNAEAAWAQFVADVEAAYNAWLEAQGGGNVQFQFQAPELPEFNFGLGADGGVNIGELLGLNLDLGANFGS